MGVESKRQGTTWQAGDWVVVRSKEEILATLDENGRLENLPFMPEMFQYCGMKLQVGKRAHKTCDYIGMWDIRGMKDAVFLDGIRCDGGGHDGCQALCLIFWKKAWLRPASGDFIPEDSLWPRSGVRPGRVCTEGMVRAATFQINSEGERIYSCQGTDVLKYSAPLKWWSPRQWLDDLQSGNLSTGLAGSSRSERRLEYVLGVLRIWRTLVLFLFNRRQQTLHGAGALQYPLVVGTQDKTPTETLNIQAGELVQIRSKEEIMRTLNRQQRNRGLWFDGEMLPYCGGIYRVLRRVTTIIEERSGKMIIMKNPCLILEGVVCKGDFHRLCQRAIYSYWREAWVRRASHLDVPALVQEKQQDKQAITRV